MNAFLKMVRARTQKDPQLSDEQTKNLVATVQDQATLLKM